MNLWSRWVDLVNRVEPGTTLAVFRVAVGLCALGTVLTVVLHGVVPDLWYPAGSGGYRADLQPPWQFGPLPLTPANVNAMVGVSLTSSALLTAGLGGRLMALICLQSTLALTDLNGQAGGSYDQLLSNATWLLVLADATRTLSLDCWLRTRRWSDDTPVHAFPRWLVVFQLVLAYASTGAQKVSFYWTPAGGFSALYYILQQPSWHRFDMSWLAWVYPLTQLATAATWIFELTAPLLLLALWYRRTPERPGRLRRWMNRLRWREAFIAFGVSLHVGVFLLMNVGPFSWITLALYVPLLDPEEWRAVGHRLLRRQSTRAA